MSGEFCRPNKAKKGHTYLCPECKEELIVRQGPNRVWHFSHQQNSECSACDPESEKHFQAKWNIYAKILKHGELTFVGPCSSCGHTQTLTVSGKPSVEKRIGGSTLRFDVLISDNRRSTQVIEILHTSPVSSDKIAFLQQHNMSCAEVDASEALGNGWLLKAEKLVLVNAGTSEPQCTTCREIQDFKQRKKRLELQIRELKRKPYQRKLREMKDVIQDLNAQIKQLKTNLSHQQRMRHVDKIEDSIKVIILRFRQSSKGSRCLGWANVSIEIDEVMSIKVYGVAVFNDDTQDQWKNVVWPKRNYQNRWYDVMEIGDITPDLIIRQNIWDQLKALRFQEY